MCVCMFPNDEMNYEIWLGKTDIKVRFYQFTSQVHKSCFLQTLLYHVL